MQSDRPTNLEIPERITRLDTNTEDGPAEDGRETIVGVDYALTPDSFRYVLVDAEGRIVEDGDYEALLRRFG